MVPTINSKPRRDCSLPERGQRRLIPLTLPSLARFKKCTKCTVTYLATPEFFPRDRSKKTGLRPICKPCACRSKQAHYKANREVKRRDFRDKKVDGTIFRLCDGCLALKPLTSEYYPTETLPSGNTYFRNKCKACRNTECRERYTDYYSTNKGRIATKRKERYGGEAEYRERINASNVRWKTSEKGRELTRVNRVKRYWLDPEHHRQLGRVHSLNRRARKNKAGGKHTKEDVRQLIALQAGRCWWCCEDVGGDFHVDHRIPIARGGGSEPANLVISCQTCNLSKGAKMPWEFTDRLL